MKNFILPALTLLITAPAFAIHGGEIAGPEDAGYKSTVLVKVKGLCTGTLIAPRIVLTAAHCADKVFSTNSSVLFPAANNEARAVIDFLQHEKYNDDDNEILRVGKDKIRTLTSNDFALLLLAEPAPAEAEIAALPKAALKKGKPVAVRTFGYGAQSAKDMTVDGKLRRLDWEGKVDPERTDLITFDQTNGRSGVCYGDSGGPSYVRYGDVNYVVSVTSQLDVISQLGVADKNGLRNIQTPQMEDACTEGSALAQTAPVRSWIEKTSKKLLARKTSTSELPCLDRFSFRQTYAKFHGEKPERLKLAYLKKITFKEAPAWQVSATMPEEPFPYHIVLTDSCKVLEDGQADPGEK